MRRARSKIFNGIQAFFEPKRLGPEEGNRNRDAACQRATCLVASQLRRPVVPPRQLPLLPSNRFVVCILLAAILLLTYSPVLRNGFVDYDDADYVTQNPHVNTGISWANSVWAFRTAYASNWHPLTWISHQIDCAIFGLTPAGPHVTNLLVHVTNMFLLFFWLTNVTRSRGSSAFVALAFGLHPVNVESVAWIAERKDVLSTLLWLLVLYSYTAYTRGPNLGRYLLTLVCLVAGLLSKPMLVSVPLLLLLLDWWPLARKERLSRLLLEKLPLLAIAAASCWVTLWAQQRGGSVTAFDGLPLELRLANAAISYVRYLGKVAWPSKLAVFYPYPTAGIAPLAVAASLGALALVTLAFVRWRSTRPWLLAGWIWYLLTLAPVIGIVQVGMQSMADRYLYVPLIGLLIAAAWQANEWAGPSRGRMKLAAAVAALLLAAWGVLTWRQAHYWKDGATLFRHAISVTDGNFVAHDNLGVELDRAGQHEEALAEYRETLRIKPGDRNGETNFAQASFAKGARLFDSGNPAAAMDAFRQGLRYRPGDALAHSYMGLILLQQAQPAAAIAEFQAALRLDRSLARAYLGLGVAQAQQGHDEDARQAFQDCLRVDPSNAEARYDLSLMDQALAIAAKRGGPQRPNARK